MWIFAVVWLSDTLAYAFGRTIGGPRLAPTISPNKTWAGLLGAVVGGALGGTLVAWFSGLTALIPLMLLAGAFGIVGQIGDLYESAAKRRQGIKDSGSIIPGHGGILDRVDALLIVSVGRTGDWNCASWLGKSGSRPFDLVELSLIHANNLFEKRPSAR